MSTRGLAALHAGKNLTPFSFDRRTPNTNDIDFSVSFAGICHSDIHQVREEWGPALFPMVPGHEIVGIVDRVGSDVSGFKPGDKIGVGVFVDSCRSCAQCVNGLEQYCAEGMTPTYNGYERDGKTISFGGYSNRFVIDQKYALHVPDSLEFSGVAPLLCAGITLYSPLRFWKTDSKTKVAIMGLGGLGHLGLKFAKTMGAHVTVLSHSAKKEQDARAMGADDFINTSDEAAMLAAEKRFDLILNTVSAELNINDFLKQLSLNGTLVCIGLPGKPYSVNVGSLLEARRSLAGSMIGGIKETQEMLNFAAEHGIVSEVEVIDANYVNTAYERTVASDVRYRFVIDAKTF